MQLCFSSKKVAIAPVHATSRLRQITIHWRKASGFLRIADRVIFFVKTGGNFPFLVLAAQRLNIAKVSARQAGMGPSNLKMHKQFEDTWYNAPVLG